MRQTFAAVLLVVSSLPLTAAAHPASAASDTVTAGELREVDSGGEARACPLEHTDVKASISGFVARVTVTQQFANPYDHAIEAVYMFPLAGDAAVDRMSMHVGDRVIVGKVARRAEARAAYESARGEGRAASLLEQERPNVFMQSVANIPPSARIDVELSYVQTLSYEAGTYHFVFPMVVGQRYVPTVVKSDGTSKKYPIAGAPAAKRPGHDITMEVTLDAGVPLVDVRSLLHKVAIARSGESAATIRLANDGEIPNRDFVLDYAVAGGQIEDALLVHRDDRGGFFTLILQPPARVAPKSVAPKEVVFALDTSGSMSGEPMEKAKATIAYALDNLYPDDTFNIVTFAGVTDVLFKQPVRATAENRAKALSFVNAATATGGTEMMDAIRTALSPSDRQDNVRIVCFLTDGYVGNDLAILGEIEKHPNARVFSLGMGDATNRFLLDKMAEEGRGDVEYVTADADASAVAERFFDRVRNPLLTDLSIDWAGLDVSSTYPARLPDVFGAKPVVVTGRYGKPGSATVRLRGTADGREVVREIPVVFPASSDANDSIAAVWARRKIDDLMRQDYAGVMARAPKNGLDEQIAQVGLDFGIATQFTSFVAIDDTPVTSGGDPEKVAIPTATVADAGDVSAEFGVGTGSGVGSGSGAGLGSEPGFGHGASAGAGYLAGSVSETVTVTTAEEVVTKSGSSSYRGVVEAPRPDGPGTASVDARAPATTSAEIESLRVDSSRPLGLERGVSVDVESSPVVTTTAHQLSQARVGPAPALVAAGAHPAQAWARARSAPGAEIVFAIDTTGSMSGLIDGAKARIWGIVNEIMRSQCRPSLRIGLVAYRDRGDAYESEILPLTDDLDLVYSTLSAFEADGGGDTPEDVRRGLSDALENAGWSPASPDLAQIIFLVGDAPPHDYADVPSTDATCTAARARGIVVHAIQCGTDPETLKSWESIAKGGGGGYFAIPQNQTVATVERTPYDSVLADLGKRIGATYASYGSLAVQAESNTRQATLERTVSMRASRSTQADRAINKAVNSLAYSGDFYQSIENGDLTLANVAQSDLPEDLRGLSPAALKKEVDRRIARRKSLRAAILDISRLRDSYIAGGAKQAANDDTLFDGAVADAVKKHLEKKGICH